MPLSPPHMRLSCRALALILGFAAAFGGGAPDAPLAPRAALADDADPDRDRALLETYRTMLASDPNQEYALRRLLAMSHAAGGLAGLVALYQRDVEADPADFAGWMVLGHLHRTAEDGERALDAYARAATLRPKAADPHLAQARLHAEARRWDAAFAAFDQAVVLTRDRTAKQDLLRAAAQAAIDGAASARAERYLDALVDSEPANVFLRMERAATLGRLAQPERALAAWADVEERARGQLKHLVIIWGEMAELQVRLDELDAAEATLRRGLERTPADHWARRSFIDGLVRIYRRQSRIPELIAELEPQARRSYELLLVVARLHEELADDAAALARYRDAIALDGRDDRARTAALRILERIGTPAEVIAEYEALVRSAPGEARHELRLGELYFQYDRAREGYALLETIARRYSGDPGVLARVIDMWMRYGDKKTARRQIEGTFKQLLRLEPDEETHIVALGEYYWALDEKDRAHATWKRILTLGRSRAAGHFLLAEVYLDYDLAQALEHYEAALALEPENTRFASAYALALERASRHSDALEAWRRVIEEADAQVVGRDAREHIIRLWTRAGRLDAEIARLERRFEDDPPDLDAGRFLGEAYVAGGRHEDAERVLGRLAELQPDDAEVLAALAAILSQRNKVREAIAAFDRLAAIEPARAVEHLHRAADLALSAGDEQLALRYARQVVELNPADPAAQAKVGSLYARMGYRSEAAEAWRQAIVLDPRAMQVKLDLAALYRDLDQPLREEQLLAEIVRDSRDPAETTRAGRRLVQLGISSGRLERVEEILRPLVGGTGRNLYLKLLIDVYAHLCQGLVYSDAGPAAREAALQAIGDRALKPLLDALGDNDIGLRGRALAVLELTHPHAAAPTLARMTSEEDAVTRVQAAVALGRIGSASAVAALARSMGSSRIELRTVSVWALGLVESEEAAAILADRYRRAPRGERALIGAALGRSAHPAGAATAAALARDSSAEMRLLGLWAMGRIGDPEAVETLGARVVGSDPQEARLAAWALGRVNTPQAAQALVDSLFASDHAPTRDIFRALSERATDRDDVRVDALYEHLLDWRGGRVQVQSPLVLVDVPTPATGPSEDASVVERHRAALAARVGEILSAPQPAPVARLLGQLLEGPRPSLVPADRPPEEAVAASAASLALLRPHRAAVERWTEDPGAPPALRARALEVLARWSVAAPEVVPAADVASRAIAQLADPRAEARLGALRALAIVGARGADVDAALIAYLAARDVGALPVADRVATAEALAGMTATEGRDSLRALVADQRPSVRRAALGVVARSAWRDALRVDVIARLSDPVADVALAAVAALADDPAGEAAVALEDARLYARPEVGQAARSALEARRPGL